MPVNSKNLWRWNKIVENLAKGTQVRIDRGELPPTIWKSAAKAIQKGCKAKMK